MALAVPRTLRAQAKQPVLIGWLNLGSREANGHLLAALKDGLAALGWKDGSQIVMDERWANAETDRLPTLARELAAKGPAVIVAGPVAAAVAAMKAAPKTPIVLTSGDPLPAGLVASLARPGGMVTGVANLVVGISEKYVELLVAAAPRLRRVGFLTDITSANHASFVEGARRSVAQYSLDARYAEVGRPEDLDPALWRLAKENVQGLVVMPGQAVTVSRGRIAQFALGRRWPVIAFNREFAEAGTLLSYGVDMSANHRRGAYYVDRILKGTKPGDLPIEQPTKLELVLNLKTAKALGLTIPQPFLMRADRVIE